MGTCDTDECCPRFEPEPWEGKELHWDEKLFVKDRVKSFLHIPLNFGAVMTRNVEPIKAVEAFEEPPLVLSDENSLWGADVYIAASDDVPGANMATISGTFLTKVFEGPYKNMRQWIEEMNTYASSQGKKAEKLYFFYTTCPKCAKKYGKNYLVILAKV
ncbi:MAG: hypothetical protein QGH42_06525 [Kiritimatiellia bacterium]|jgi:hypothetical protein|nr:hypothetical protein [Kiritimatiellia bacterium]MDP6809445.1 hypothetical protein [Kiritimatiellia bacterium]MDP7023878.1 hypothetical protein [Kiritimatiellia bacterium]